MKKISWILAFLFFSPLTHAQFEDEEAEPLMPEEAFQLRAFAKDAHTVTAEWTIAEGYYLYKEKFKFSTDSAGYSLGPAAFPQGKVKEDEFFGKVETYRHQMAVDIPVNRGEGDTLELTTVSQGCADIGLCYPPQTVTVSVAMLPAEPAPAPPEKQDSLSLLGQLSDKLGIGGQETFLEVDQAFAFSSEVMDGNTLLAHWDVADGYYLYKNKFTFTLVDADGIEIGAPAFPDGAKVKQDEYFGRMEVYYHEVPVRLPLLRTALDATDVKLRVEYQGCAEKGFCYPPQERLVDLSLPAGTAGVATLAEAPPASADDYVSEQDSIAQSLAADSIGWIILSFFGFGLLLAFTPCVFPMVPILSSIIVGQGETLSTRKAFTMSLVYVLAMALTYTVAGVIAGVSGANLQAAFQNPWILSIFAGVFVLLAFSMFGFYELQLTASWQAKLTEISNKQKGGTLTGVAVMGFLSALIVGPCVAAPLAGALIYISQTGDAVLGGVALFALSMGMGMPLLAIGTSAGKLLPKAGGWMEAVKAVFGVLLLAVAVWMLERILPAQITLVLWALLLMVSAVYMGALEHLHEASSGWKRLWKGLGVVFLVYGVILLVSAASGGRDPLHPLGNLMMGSAVAPGGQVAAVEETHFKKIKSVKDLDREIAAANAAGRPVMLDFYADWCVSCKEMERYTFSRPGVQAVLDQGVLLQADVTANDDIDKALMKRFGIIGPPAILFFDRQGQERRNMRVVGFMEAAEFQAVVERAFQS